MAMDADFLDSLMKIPYFKQLSEENGEEWLESVFAALEIKDYDFSRFETLRPSIVSLSIDEAIGLDIAGSDSGAPDTVVDNAAADVDSTDDNVVKAGAPEQAQRQRRQVEEIADAELPRQAKSTAATDDSSASGGRRFDNAAHPRKVLPVNSETLMRYPQQWLALHDSQAKFSMNDSETPAVVGLNGIYHRLRLTAFDDKIYTANGWGKTTVRGGEGSDTLYLTAGGLKADLGGKSDFGRFGGMVVLQGVENVVGSDGDDRILGNVADNKLVGRSGDDYIDGGAGNDTITGGGGKNTLHGGGGNDTITGGNLDDRIDGGKDDDTLNGGGGNDRISGGDGNDNVDGGSGSDRIDGGAGNDTLKGGDGSDKIDGGDGNDTVYGGDGSDRIDGGGGNDVLNGDGGNDKIDGGGGNDTINGGAGDDVLNGQAGNDKIDGGDGKDTINGGSGKDTLTGGKGNDTIDGGTGDDDIDGGDGDDVILGGDGADVIKGGAGNDTVTGGAGADTITGGDGNDVYVYTAKTDSGVDADTFDIIKDFSIADDKFDFTALLENDVFHFIAAEGGAFTGTQAEVRWDKTGGNTLIEIDIDGDGTADMKIQLDGGLNLTEANFNL